MDPIQQRYLHLVFLPVQQVLRDQPDLRDRQVQQAQPVLLVLMGRTVAMVQRVRRQGLERRPPAQVQLVLPHPVLLLLKYLPSLYRQVLQDLQDLQDPPALQDQRVLLVQMETMGQMEAQALPDRQDQQGQRGRVGLQDLQDLLAQTVEQTLLLILHRS